MDSTSCRFTISPSLSLTSNRPHKDEDMTNTSRRRVLRAVVVLVTSLSSLILASKPAVSAWNIGTPIVTYWNGPGTLLWGEHFGTLDDAAAQQIVDGNFTVALASTYAEVQVAQLHGLRTMFQSDLLSAASLDGGTKQTQLDAMIDQYKTSPAAYSYLIADEPSAAAFSDLGRIVSYIRQRDPDHLACINLLPNHASVSQLGTDDYDAYLSLYKNTVQPSLLSYDHYQLCRTSDGAGYLQNLATISQAAKQAGVPFMNTVQACSWDTTTMRVPNAAETRFLIYSTLAYGAQGISYFQYAEADAPQLGGIVKRNGTPMPIFPTIQAGNREFLNIAKQYQSLNYIGTYLKGYRASAKPPGTILLPSTGSPFTITGVSNRSYTDGDPLKGVLIGLFDTDGTAIADATFALVANLDYTYSHTYTVTGPGLLSCFDATTGVWTAMESNRVALTLLPGSGVLVALTSEIPTPEPGDVTLLSTGMLWYGWRKTTSKCKMFPWRR